MAKKKAHKTRRISKKPYNVDRAIEAHERLRSKNFNQAARNHRDDEKYAHYYGKYYYHDDMMSELVRRQSKVPPSEKKFIYENAQRLSRKHSGL